MSESILDVVHQTAKGLHKAGVMDVTTLREIETLCLPPVKSFTANQIKRLRQQYKVSQPIFAEYLNISASTVQKWESGQKQPNGSSLKLLNLVEQKGLEVLA
ncbi:MAG: DNA-binding transcriptional regulator [Algicola sp.]|nr:DNA-binding transcriptional regulator [Algicola sp.]